MQLGKASASAALNTGGSQEEETLSENNVLYVESVWIMTTAAVDGVTENCLCALIDRRSDSVYAFTSCKESRPAGKDVLTTVHLSRCLHM